MKNDRRFLSVVAALLAAGFLWPAATSAAAGSSVDLKFTDGAGKTFTARITEIEIDCSAPEMVELELNTMEFEEAPRARGESAADEDGAKQGWGLKDLVGDVLRDARGLVLRLNLSHQLLEVRQKGRPAVTSGPLEGGEGNPLSATSRFSRADLGMGRPYRAGDPNALKSTVDVSLVVNCPRP